MLELKQGLLNTSRNFRGGNMVKKNLGIIFTGILLVTVVFFYFYNSEELYGNDKDSIVKVIQSIEGYETKQIEILKINDFNKVRIVGFLSNSNPSYIEFHKNEEGNYVWKHIESKNDESFSLFLSSVEGSKMMFVTNNNNKIAEMHVEINGNTLERKFTPHKASVTWIDMPQTNKDSYEFRNYKYYDKGGNLIKNN
ncbi:hypothetical protein [Halobacillus seohaensis]|uniref:DUF4178 domain-containing protein n=1 Tax=Halobacillus seohaensis TaxID=447421 RepID=A0ABW2EKL7_9BACI